MVQQTVVSPSLLADIAARLANENALTVQQVEIVKGVTPLLAELIQMSSFNLTVRGPVIPNDGGWR